jgi:uncharacterized OB-fold protein
MTDGPAGPVDDPPRETVTLPDSVAFPRLLDFYERQDAAHTGIHPFYDHLRDGRLTTTVCDDCASVHFPPRIVCPACTSDALSYTSLPHRGELHSFTEVRGPTPIGMDDAPFVVGVVDLGPVRLSARIDDADYGALAIGDTVRLKVVTIEGPGDASRVFYRFVPV